MAERVVGKFHRRFRSPMGAPLLLSLLCSKFSCCLLSNLLCIDGLLHLLHLLLHERHCSSEIILVSIITHCGVSRPRVLTVMSF